jgi:hypothetical protein
MLVAAGPAVGGPGPDTDGDGIADPFDNCLFQINPTQHDTDEDGLGNRCDIDYNNDGFTGTSDFGLFRAAYGAVIGDALYDEVMDCNVDGAIQVFDFGCMREYYGTTTDGLSGRQCARLPYSLPASCGFPDLTP